MEKKLQRMYLTYYNLLIAQDSWPFHYQIMSIIFLKEFIELNSSVNMTIKILKHVKLNVGVATSFLNIQILKVI